MKKKILLSFDYELFFGIRSGTVYNTLIVPTNKLLDFMDLYNLKGNAKFSIEVQKSEGFQA